MPGQRELQQQKGGLKQPSIFSFFVFKYKPASFKVKFAGDKLLKTSLLRDLYPSCFASSKALTSNITTTAFPLYFERRTVLFPGCQAAIIRLFASPSTSTLCCSPLISYLTRRQQENYINCWCQIEKDIFIYEEIL